MTENCLDYLSSCVSDSKFRLASVSTTTQGTPNSFEVTYFTNVRRPFFVLNKQILQRTEFGGIKSNAKNLYSKSSGSMADVPLQTTDYSYLAGKKLSRLDYVSNSINVRFRKLT